MSELKKMYRWVNERVKKMNEVMIGWLNEERLGERSLIISYQIHIDKGYVWPYGCIYYDVKFG